MPRILNKPAQTEAVQLVRAIEQLGKSAEQIAEACLVSYSTVSRWRRGVSFPHPLQLAKLRELSATAIRDNMKEKNDA